MDGPKRYYIAGGGGQKWAYEVGYYKKRTMVLIIYYCSGERNRFLYSVRSDADEIVFTIRKGEISKGYFEIWLLYLIYGLHISREKFLS